MSISPFKTWRLALAGALMACVQLASQAPGSEVWTFDRLDSIGGHTTTILGDPRIVETPQGKAVQFDGVDDALFIGVHPLAGAATFTWEVIFRPDSGGSAEQRFFHLQEQDPKTGADTPTRLLFEIRVIGDRWCLDSFALSGKASRALLNRERLHPLDAWYHAAMVYDGKEFRNYVDGVLEGAGELNLAPQGPGRSSVGVRINRIDYFKGAIRMTRLTRRALAPDQFLRLPPDRAGSIAPGKDADLVLLDADPLADITNTRRISAVILKGKPR